MTWRRQMTHHHRCEIGCEQHIQEHIYMYVHDDSREVRLRVRGVHGPWRDSVKPGPGQTRARTRASETERYR